MCALAGALFTTGQVQAVHDPNYPLPHNFTGSGDAQVGVDADGDGIADTITWHVPGWPSYAPRDDVFSQGCEHEELYGGMFPIDICDTWNGYGYGTQVLPWLANQRVCFSYVGTDITFKPQSVYQLGDKSPGYNPIDFTDNRAHWGRPIAPTDRDLQLAIQDYNRDRNPDIGAIRPGDRNVKVATIDNYNALGHWGTYPWPYSAHNWSNGLTVGPNTMY